MITRYAEKDDLPEVFVMYLAGIKEIQEHSFPVNESKALDTVIKGYNSAPCILLEDNGELIGFAGLKTTMPDYSDVVLLRDYMFYVHPDHRSLRAWRMMCKAVQDVADKFQLDFIGTHKLTDEIPKHERMIRSAGATPWAISAIYRCKDGR